MANRPNIILMMSDQQKASATSVYGNTLVSTPLTDRLAASGWTCRDAYSASSICTPSRASLHTGVHPLVHGVTCHQNRAPWNLPQMAELMTAAGYYTAVIGHYELLRNLGRGWHEQVDAREYGPLQKAYYRKYGTPGEFGWSAGPTPCTAEEGHSYLMAERAIRMLDTAAATGAPFFLHIAFDDPHPPFNVPPPYDTIVDRASLPVPEQGDGRGRPRWQTMVRGEYRTELATDDDLSNLLAVYYGMIMYVDDQMQRIHDALESRGLLENTWIIFASDHGDFTGEKGLFTKAESLYECLLHVPLIICPPAGRDARRGERFSGLVSLVDLFPTILGLGGAEVPRYAQGHDLIEWAEQGATQPLHDVVFAQVGDYHGYLKNTLPSGVAAASRRAGLVQGARSHDFSYVRDPDYGDEAYDLRHDPGELFNLLNGTHVDAPPQVAVLRRQVEEWEAQCLRLQADLGVIPGDRGFVEGWE